MIKLRQGDILQTDAEALVNTVNCVGIMGRGIALQFRKAFPENYEAYRAVCNRGELQPGRMFVYDLNRLVNPRYIINFPTKRHWKSPSRLEDIDSGLEALVKEIRERDIRSVAVPPLGCGLGGLHWPEVRPRIEAAFRDLPEVTVFLHEPAGAPPAEKMVKRNQAPRMTLGRATLLGLTQRYLAAVMDPHVSLLEIHKLMYFMQEAGQELRLRYQKAPYGPYAENLRHVLSEIEGHFISGYGDAHDRPDVQVQPMPEAVQHAETFLDEHPETRRRFDRVARLIEGFETPFGMELLATVHWVATREGAATLDDAVRQAYGWGERKRMFQEAHLRVAWEALRDQGWLATASASES
jgi:O-acetyl-ADP-ribose deacetylase (regulator of RNase III)